MVIRVRNRDQKIQRWLTRGDLAGTWEDISVFKLIKLLEGRVRDKEGLMCGPCDEFTEGPMVLSVAHLIAMTSKSELVASQTITYSGLGESAITPFHLADFAVDANEFENLPPDAHRAIENLQSER